MSQLMYYEKPSTKPMAWNVQMSIGDDIKIPISGYKKVKLFIIFNLRIS